VTQEIRSAECFNVPVV